MPLKRNLSLTILLFVILFSYVHQVWYLRNSKESTDGLNRNCAEDAYKKAKQFIMDQPIHRQATVPKDNLCFP